MGGRGDNIRIGQRAHVQAGRNQTRDVRHIDKQVRANLVRDLSELGKVDRTRISGRARNNHLGLLLLGEITQRIIIDIAVIIHAVRDDIIQQAGLVDRRAVRQMAAVIQAHAQHGVARLAQRLIYRHVGLRARVGLHIGVLRAEYFTHTLDGKVLNHVHTFAAAIVALARITFRIFVGQHRAHRSHNRLADDVLRCNQLDIACLTVILRLHHIAQFGIIRLDEIHCFAYHSSTSIKCVLAAPFAAAPITAVKRA